MSSLTDSGLLRARETEAVETPAARATSTTVGTPARFPALRRRWTRGGISSAKLGFVTAYRNRLPQAITVTVSKPDRVSESRQRARHRLPNLQTGRSLTSPLSAP